MGIHTRPLSPDEAKSPLKPAPTKLWPQLAGALHGLDDERRYPPVRQASPPGRGCVRFSFDSNLYEFDVEGRDPGAWCSTAHACGGLRAPMPSWWLPAATVRVAETLGEAADLSCKGYSVTAPIIDESLAPALPMNPDGSSAHGWVIA